MAIDSPAQSQPNTLSKSRLIPYLITGTVLALLFAVIAARGFGWGMYKDVLAYEWHYETLGVRQGWRWLIHVHWTRHLLAGIVSAPIHLLFPNNDAAWYAFATLVHFVNGILLFLLVDTLQRGKRPWLSFAVTLLFIFNSLQIFSHLDLGTGSHRKVAMGLTLLSTWCYLLYSRSNRQKRWFFYFSFALLAIANSIYEQSMLFFALHPIIAFPEDWMHFKDKSWWAYLNTIARDSFLFIAFNVFLVLLLASLFTSTSNFELSVPYILGQIQIGFTRELNPLLILERLQPAFLASNILVTLIISGALLAGLFFWMKQDEVEQSDHTELSWLAVVGFSIMFLNILNAAPTDFTLAWHERLIYISSAGVALLLAALIARFSSLIPTTVVQKAIFSLVFSVLIGSGFITFLEMQRGYLERDAIRVGVADAIEEAIPSWEDVPYLLIISDLHPDDELHLNAQDINFPYTFDLLYDTEGILADVVFFDVSEANDFQMIRSTSDGIVSPLRPTEVIDPNRLVVLFYDSITDEVTILDRVPEDVLETGNFLIEEPIEWETNYSLFNETTVAGH